MFPEISDYFKTNPVLSKGWRRICELFGSLGRITPITDRENQKIQEHAQEWKQMVLVHAGLRGCFPSTSWTNGAPVEEDGAAPFPARVSPPPLPAFPLSFIAPFQGQSTSIEEPCSLLQAQVVLSSPPPEELHRAVIYTKELRPHHFNAAEISKLLPAPQGQSPSSSRRWGHSLVTH